MTAARKLISTGSAMLLAAAAAGCMNSGGDRMIGPEARAPQGVEGRWVDEKGTGVSTFSGGVFQTVASDTGQKLADGSYQVSGGRNVAINGTSLIRGAPISFNCLLASPSQLNCTSSAGAQFILTRRTA